MKLIKTIFGLSILLFSCNLNESKNLQSNNNLESTVTHRKPAHKNTFRIEKENEGSYDQKDMDYEIGSDCDCCYNWSKCIGGLICGSCCCICDNFRLITPCKKKRRKYEEYLRYRYGVLLEIGTGKFNPSTNNSSYKPPFTPLENTINNSSFKIGRLLGNIFGVFSWYLFFENNR
ncbi:MAG: hypothetical protein GY830_05980 [Bacteroidetes bacterium]|nr:hypothetical protein [Bacteroidota bacterium]